MDMPIPRAADEDPAVVLAARDRVRDLERDVRVVDRVLRMAAEIRDLEPVFLHDADQALQAVASIVAADRHRFVHRHMLRRVLATG
jgi:hypothetical protein